jgi:hypothetical protein
MTRGGKSLKLSSTKSWRVGVGGTKGEATQMWDLCWFCVWRPQVYNSISSTVGIVTGTNTEIWESGCNWVWGQLCAYPPGCIFSLSSFLELLWLPHFCYVGRGAGSERTNSLFFISTVHLHSLPTCEFPRILGIPSLSSRSILVSNPSSKPSLTPWHLSILCLALHPHCLHSRLPSHPRSPGRALRELPEIIHSSFSTGRYESVEK